MRVSLWTKKGSWFLLAAVVAAALWPLTPASAGEIHVAVISNNLVLAGSTLRSDPSAARATLPDGTTPLHLAAALNRVKIAALLIRCGADVRAGDLDGVTPLHQAVLRNSIHIAALLLDSGADPNAANKLGRSALDLARARNARDMVQVLLLPRKTARAGREPRVPGREGTGAVKASVKGEAFARGYSDRKKDNEYEASTSADTRLKMEGNLSIADQGIDARLGGELRDRYVSTGDGETEAFLREAWLRMRKDKHSLTVGNQVVTWGKLDDVFILDVLSPQDYTRFLLLKKQERKIPEPMIKYDYFGERLILEAVDVGRFVPSRIDYFGSDWAMFDHAKELAAAAMPAAAPFVNGIRVVDDPDLDENGMNQYAFRARTTVLNIDVALDYIRVYDAFPTLVPRTIKGRLTKDFLYNPTAETLGALAMSAPSADDLTLEKHYGKMDVLGLEWETVASEYGLRGEMGFFSRQPYQAADLTEVRKQTVSAGVGVDHRTPDDFYWNLQLRCDRILDYEELYNTEETSEQMALNLSKELFAGNLTLAVSWIMRFPYDDWMVNPEVTYRFGSGLQATYGAFFFGGDVTTLFGRFDTKDMLYLQLKCNF